MRADLERVLALAHDRAIDVPVAGRFTLSDAAAALRFAERGGVIGKVVLVPDA